METQDQRRHGPAVFEGQPAVHDVMKQAWYEEDVTSIPASAREILESYSGIKPEDVLPHVLALRDKSFKIWSYACIGQMRFLTYNLSLLPFHQTILNRLRSGDKFVDAGCCFGQEIRYLVQDGAPAAQLYGFDLESAFIKCGFELFRDQDRLQSTFAHGDILAPAGTSQRGTLDKLNAVGDIVFASSFLHVWDWDEMILAAKGLVAMTQPRPGSTVVGKQLGSYKAGRYKMPTSSGYNYRHNADSIKRFWDQVGRETDSSWTVEADTYQGAELAQNRDHAWSEPDMCMVWFVATRQ